jgi:hypothetical protein
MWEPAHEFNANPGFRLLVLWRQSLRVQIHHDVFVVRLLVVDADAGDDAVRIDRRRAAEYVDLRFHHIGASVALHLDILHERGRLRRGSVAAGRAADARRDRPLRPTMDGLFRLRHIDLDRPDRGERDLRLGHGPRCMDSHQLQRQCVHAGL